jgi:hypothetical protein
MQEYFSDKIKFSSVDNQSMRCTLCYKVIPNVLIKAHTFYHKKVNETEKKPNFVEVANTIYPSRIQVNEEIINHYEDYTNTSKDKELDTRKSIENSNLISLPEIRKTQENEKFSKSPNKKTNKEGLLYCIDYVRKVKGYFSKLSMMYYRRSILMKTYYFKKLKKIINN